MEEQKNAPFKGVGALLPTPFDSLGNVDFFAFFRILKRILKDPPSALVVLTPFSEEASLSKKEWLRLGKEAFLENDLPVIFGCFGHSEKEIQEKARRARSLGASALLVGKPYALENSKKGLYAHYERVSEIAETPMILYDPLPLSLLFDFMRIPQVKGAMLPKIFPPEFLEYLHFSPLPLYYNGEEGLLFPKEFRIAGCFSRLFSLFPKELRALSKMSPDEAFSREKVFFPLIKMLCEHPSPALVKWILHKEGLASPFLRLPYSFESYETEALFEGLWASIKNEDFKNLEGD